VLAEFGDDALRYRDARVRKNYAGTSPIAHQSGRKKSCREERFTFELR
jgi:hypothetical protein